MTTAANNQGNTNTNTNTKPRAPREPLTPVEAISKVSKILEHLSPADRKRVLAFVSETNE
jgi:hypothetical protein